MEPTELLEWDVALAAAVRVIDGGESAVDAVKVVMRGVDLTDVNLTGVNLTGVNVDHLEAEALVRTGDLLKFHAGALRKPFVCDPKGFAEKAVQEEIATNGWQFEGKPAEALSFNLAQVDAWVEEWSGDLPQTKAIREAVSAFRAHYESYCRAQFPGV